MAEDWSCLLIKLTLRETLKEISSCILEDARLDDEYAFYICLYYFHDFLNLLDIQEIG